MAEEPLITESKRPQIKAIIKSIAPSYHRTRQENIVEERARVRACQETQGACATFD